MAAGKGAARHVEDPPMIDVLKAVRPEYSEQEAKDYSFGRPGKKRPQGEARDPAGEHCGQRVQSLDV